MSKQILVYKAFPIGAQVIEDLVVHATLTPPENIPLHTAEELYRVQGKALADAFAAALPGGLLHQLLVELLIQKTNLLRVPDHVSEPNAAAFVQMFAEWWEDAGHVYYSDDEGLAYFYKDACTMLAREPMAEAIPS